MELGTLIEYFCTVLVSSGLVVWAAKALISYWIDKGVEKYKNNLQLQSEAYKGNMLREMESYKSILNLEIEKHRAELARVTNEHSIKFSRLHVDRAKVIQEFYSMLYSLDTSLKSLLAPFQKAGDKTLTEKFDIVIDSFNSMFPFYFEHKIFFDKEMCVLIENIIKEMRAIIAGVNILPIEYDHPAYKDREGLINEKRDFMNESWKKMNGEINSAKEKLEDSFRELLGV